MGHSRRGAILLSGRRSAARGGIAPCRVRGPSPKLKTIKVPTVVVHREDDPIIAVEAGRDVAANIPGAEFRLLPGLGHVFPPALDKDIADAITAAASRATGTKTAK